VATDVIVSFTAEIVLKYY